MTLEEMILHLRAFDRTLDKVYSVSIYGGSAMMLHGLRDSSLDIDVFGSLANSYELERKAEEYASKNNLQYDWLNFAITEIILEDLIKTDLTVIDLNLKNLKVSLPSKEQLLAMKLFSARDKDKDDILRLIKELNIKPTRATLQRLLRVYFNEVSIRERGRSHKNVIGRMIDSVVDEYEENILRWGNEE